MTPMRRFIFLAALLVMAGRHPATALGHGVGSRELESDRAKVMAFLYADGEPMAFAQVLVHAPGESEAVYLSAHTDRLGHFAFVPSAPGMWLVEAKDGEGHRAVREIELGQSNHPTPSIAQEPACPRWRSVLLGLSLLVNLAFGAAWAGQRRKK
jgi:nickel transport protein